MPHTQSRYQADLGFTDGRIWAGAGDVVFTGATLAVTRVAAGEWGIVLGTPAAQANTFALNVTQSLIRKTGFSEDLQELFGAANPNSPAATAIPGSAQVRNYRPDQIGSMNTGQQIQPRTALKTKGLKLVGFDAVYAITTLALTSNTCRVDQTVFVNNVAPAITSLLASGANGLATATQAQPYVTTVNLTTSSYIITPDSNIWIEMVMTGAATSNLTFFGFDLFFEYNYN
jgi:hypothetical protein